MYVLFIYIILISIILVLQEERDLIASNEQVYDFYKWVIFEKKGIAENFFWYQWVIQCNTGSCCEHMAIGVN